MRYTKHYSSPTELLTILQDRGLDCSDIDDAESILRSVGYYRLSGYLYPFLKVPKLHINTPIKEKNKGKGQKGNKRTSLKSELPELTIPNLYAEIIQNRIQYPKIVLAQAILETGWFTSPVCRNKHNLFGLTNPRAGKYFEFGHWTESVRAYYTKVQYKFKGGDYLLWLKNIGYAEDPRYVRSLSRILEQYL